MSGERVVLAVLIHDAECADQRCEPQTWPSWWWKAADAILAAGYKSPAERDALRAQVARALELADDWERASDSEPGEFLHAGDASERLHKALTTRGEDV